MKLRDLISKQRGLEYYYLGESACKTKIHIFGVHRCLWLAIVKFNNEEASNVDLERLNQKVWLTAHDN